MSDQKYLDIISQNYKDALDKEPFDLSRATTPEQVTAIQANVSAAREIYYIAIASELTNNNENVDKAYKAASDAQKALEYARNKSEEIPKIINKLKSATNSASELLNFVKKT